MYNFISFSEFQARTNKSNQLSQENVTSPTQTALPPGALQNTKDTIELNQTAQAQNSSDVKEYFEDAKKQNGLIEKITDKIKGLTGLGLSSKKLEKTLSENISDDEKFSAIDKYRASNENTAQAAADAASCAASIGVFFKAKQAIQTNLAKLKINDWKLDKYTKKSLSEFKLGKIKMGKVADFIENSVGKKYAFIVPAMLLAGIAGGFVKNTLLKINRAGTSQYKPKYTENTDKAQKKKAKKLAQKKKANADFRNFASGFINGISTPVLTLGAAAAPLYLAVNSLSRYFIGTREDRGEKSAKSYIENLKTTPLTHALSAALIALPAIKQGKFNKVFDKNLEAAIGKLKNAELTESLKSKTSYEQLEEIIFGDEKVQKIMQGAKYEGIKLKEDEKIKLQIQDLIDENIFAVKFKQINSSDDTLTRALKEKCPSTWGDKAQSIIDNAFGKGKYTIQSSLGAGTVAETYIVKDEKGEEFCVKMLKKGMTKEKILKDKEAFKKLIQNAQDKTPDEKEFLIKNLDSISDGILQEIDLKNEMKAADELRKVTTRANVVEGVDVKDNIYVMKKAQGVSLKTLSDYIDFNPKYANKRIEELEEDIKKYGDDSWMSGWYKGKLQELKDKMKIYESLKDEIGEVSKKEAKALMEQYEDVLIEQFSKVGTDGKIIHGDIHSGNIFVDLKALRENLPNELERKAKRIAGVKNPKPALTLIDTGNTINQTQEQAQRFKNLTKYIQNGDWENITNFVLEGAKLPEGTDKQKAYEIISKELQKAFFDDKTYTGPVTNDTILAITDSIMQKSKIIPASTQGALSKTKKSADTSMKEFKNAFYNKLMKKLEEKFENVDFEDFQNMNKAKQTKLAAQLLGESTKAVGEMGESELEYAVLKKLQERKNLASMTPSERLKLKRSKSTPDKNSQEYLTYVLKQAKKPKSQDKYDSFLSA